MKPVRVTSIEVDGPINSRRNKFWTKPSCPIHLSHLSLSLVSHLGPTHLLFWVLIFASCIRQRPTICLWKRENDQVHNPSHQLWHTQPCIFLVHLRPRYPSHHGPHRLYYCQIKLILWIWFFFERLFGLWCHLIQNNRQDENKITCERVLIVDGSPSSWNTLKFQLSIQILFNTNKNITFKDFIIIINVFEKEK